MGCCGRSRGMCGARGMCWGEGLEREGSEDTRRHEEGPEHLLRAFVILGELGEEVGPGEAGLLADAVDAVELFDGQVDCTAW